MLFIPCRMTDWKGTDNLATIAQWLPDYEAAQPSSERDEDDALLEPIFSKAKTTTRNSSVVEKTPHELLVIQLVPLVPDQYRKLTPCRCLRDRP